MYLTISSILLAFTLVLLTALYIIWLDFNRVTLLFGLSGMGGDHFSKLSQEFIISRFKKKMCERGDFKWRRIKVVRVSSVE